MTDAASASTFATAGSLFVDFAKMLVPAILGAALSGYGVSRWKNREDGVEKRVDEMCAEIKSLASEASAYWLTPANDDGLYLAQSKVSATMTRVNGLLSLLSPHISEHARREVAQQASQFLRDATGDDFGVHNRPASVLKAANAVLAAAQYTVVIRKARMLDLLGKPGC